MKNGRRDRLRTCDLVLPEHALYLTELHPDEELASPTRFERACVRLAFRRFRKPRAYGENEDCFSGATLSPQWLAAQEVASPGRARVRATYSVVLFRHPEPTAGVQSQRPRRRGARVSKCLLRLFVHCSAEGAGFEPAWPFDPSAFEAAPFDQLRHPSAQQCVLDVARHSRAVFLIGGERVQSKPIRLPGPSVFKAAPGPAGFVLQKFS